jgi:hypothetical protein
MVFRPIAEPDEVRIPDQRALLWWSNGWERLTIETRFVGKGSNFAWVIPLPAPPKIDAATSGLFPTLVSLFEPEVRHHVTRWFLGFVIVTGLAWLILNAGPTGHLLGTDWVACAATSIGIFFAFSSPFNATIVGIFSFGLLLVIVIRTRTKGDSIWTWLVGIILFLIFSGMFLPALSSVGSHGLASTAKDMEILDHQLAGVFETTTLTARNSTVLQDWLTKNGYALPKEAEPVVADYLREGWVFVASKIHTDLLSSNYPRSIHPLSFTFQTTHPVYPLRLTGAAGNAVSIELIVFGPLRAKARDFETTQCRPVYYNWTPTTESFPLSARRLKAFHPGLTNAAPTAAFATKLNGTLAPDQMRSDTFVEWDGKATKDEIVYSTRGAAITAANWAAVLPCAAILTLAVHRRKAVTAVQPMTRLLSTAAGASVVIGIFSFFSLPMVEVRLRSFFDLYLTQSGATQLALEAANRLSTNEPITIQSVRKALAASMPWVQKYSRTNLHCRLPDREEDSPLNYSLRQTPQGVELLFYDWTGAAKVIHTYD